MPMRTEPSASPGLRTHSCSEVYFRSSGYTALLCRHGLSAGYSWSLGLGVLRGRGLTYGGDVERVELLQLDLRVGVALVLRDRAVDQLERTPECVRVADRVEDVRRRHQRPVDAQSPGCRLDRALGDQPHLAVDLHRLRAGRAELLDGVEDGVHVDRPRALRHRHADAGPGHRDPPGHDAE